MLLFKSVVAKDTNIIFLLPSISNFFSHLRHLFTIKFKSWYFACQLSIFLILLFCANMFGISFDLFLTNLILIFFFDICENVLITFKTEIP